MKGTGRKGEGERLQWRGRDLLDQCQAASYAPVTHRYTRASIATKWHHPPINSSAASVVSANVHQQTEAQRGQDRTAVHQLRSLLSSTERQLPVLKIGANTAVASSHVHLLSVDISLPWIWPPLVSAWAAFADFVNSGISSGRWTLTRWPRSSMLGLTLEWIIVTAFWPVHQGQ